MVQRFTLQSVGLADQMELPSAQHYLTVVTSFTAKAFSWRGAPQEAADSGWFLAALIRGTITAIRLSPGRSPCTRLPEPAIHRGISRLSARFDDCCRSGDRLAVDAQQSTTKHFSRQLPGSNAAWKLILMECGDLALFTKLECPNALPSVAADFNCTCRCGT